MRRFLLLLIIGAFMSASAKAGELFVSAAASLVDVMKEIGARHEKRSGDKTVFNFGASSLLARQIEEGAPADVFISADEAQMDRLEKAGLIARETRTDLVTNRLVVVMRKNAPQQIKEIADIASPMVARIALADPQSVPAGIYARQFLTNAGLWERVRDKIVPAENVRAALAVVESGNVDIGIVYKTDVVSSPKIQVVLAAPPELSPKIVYPVARLTNALHGQEASRFLDFVKSSEARQVYERAGFGVAQ